MTIAKMLADHVIISIILAATIALFMWGRWRFDIVALAALLMCVFAGLVPADQAFTGFSHPAVITVAAVLVLSRGLQTSGALDSVTQRVLPSRGGPVVAIAVISGIGALMSAFMNNVGAMALLMPVAVQFAERHELPPGRVLMPLAFGTILGGMTTLIGTPPNLIVAGFRRETGAGAFNMFDFTPVGVVVALTGLAFIALIGWRLVPTRQKADMDSFDTGKYLAEVHVPEDSKAVGKSLRDVEDVLEEADAQIVGMARNKFRVSAPNLARILRPDDILVIEADPESLSAVLSGLGLRLEQDVPRDDDSATDKVLAATATEERKEEENGEPQEIELQELVVRPDSALIGRTASDIHLRAGYGLNLLALSRQGRRTIKRLRSTAVKAGDVLLMQGPMEALAAFSAEFDCVPLAKRAIHIPDKRRAVLASLVMIAAIMVAAVGVFPAAIAFAAGVLLYLVLRIVPPRTVYDSIDWPVIVLLGALIPVAEAVRTSGAADMLAGFLLNDVAMGNAVVSLALILVVAMVLSDFVNNAATAALMCPIAISVADNLQVNVDTFLMAVAIGASCAFLTPIGHQNNTLILGPGGFRFGDYWRLGLPMELIVVLVGMPMLLLVWPL